MAEQLISNQPVASSNLVISFIAQGYKQIVMAYSCKVFQKNCAPINTMNNATMQQENELQEAFLELIVLDQKESPKQKDTKGAKTKKMQ